MPASARPLDLMQFEAEGAGKAQLDQLAGAFGLTRGQAESVMASVLPEISRNLERQSLSRGGVADILSMLGEAGTKPVDLAKDTGLSRGNALLEQVFGTRDASRAVAARASRASGVGDTVIKAMLPYIIQMVMGAFARRASGGLGDILSKIPDIGAVAPSRNDSRSAGRPPQNPYGDLSDIVRRGGSGNSAGGSPVWRVVRNILGTALGFQSRGIMSWILRYVVMRYGGAILRTILSRALGRR